jgi:hypothetical protein
MINGEKITFTVELQSSLYLGLYYLSDWNCTAFKGWLVRGAIAVSSMMILIKARYRFWHKG